MQAARPRNTPSVLLKQGNLDDLKAIVARLPDASKLTLADAEEDVETAYSLYQAGQSQRSDFGSKNYNKLMACKRMPVLKAIAAVTAAAIASPQQSCQPSTLADKQTVADAQAAWIS